MARRVPISKKFSAPKPLFTAKHRGNDLYSGALRCAVCFMSSAAALPYKTGERRRAGFWRGGLRELDPNRSGGLKGLNSPFKKTAVRLLGSSHCQNREVVLPTSVFSVMCVTECSSNVDARKKYKKKHLNVKEAKGTYDELSGARLWWKFNTNPMFTLVRRVSASYEVKMAIHV